jgi:circadian clock protein KaiC
MAPDREDLIAKVAEILSEREYTAEKDVSVLGRSGAKHRFDLLVELKNGKGTRLAILSQLSEDIIRDISVFNAYAEDCGIELKILFADRELGDPELNLLQMYHISVINSRSNKIVKLRPPMFGIHALDRKLEGTMTRGNVYMISGKVGVGKTVMALHFLIQGARMGEKGAIILTSMKREKFVEYAESFKMGFEEFFRDGSIEVVEVSSLVLKLRSETYKNPKNYEKYVNKLTSDIKNFAKNSDIKRLVIDPVTPLMFENEDLIILFFEALSLPNTITIVTDPINKTDTSSFGVEEHCVAGLIKLDTVDADEAIRTASIVKMNSGPYDASILHFKITSEGIVPSDLDDNGSILERINLNKALA